MRRALREHAAGDRLLVALSGGADSVALAAAVAFEAPRLGIEAGAVVVDHQLQPGSATVAGRAAALAGRLGLRPVLTAAVEPAGAGGVEAAARRARYGALRGAAERERAGWVLLGHTLDDQAETVLLGLGRGSGPRSIAGMATARRPWLRPLLAVRRATTRAACAAEGLPVWDDPHNLDPAFRRVRLRREVLPLLEEVLGGGVAPALARTAGLLGADVAALDAEALRLAAQRSLHPGQAELPLAELDGLPEALRRRVLRIWLADLPGVTATHLEAVDRLVVAWRGQGVVYLPRATTVLRRHGRLHRRAGGAAAAGDAAGAG